MAEGDGPTESDLEELARRLEAFGDELPPRQQAVFRDLLVEAAGARSATDPPEGGAATYPDERSVPTGSHAENHAAETRWTVPAPRTFYVMGVPVFEY